MVGGREISTPPVGAISSVEQPKGNSTFTNAKPSSKSTAKRPDYRKIHALPLPLVVHPLPTLIPHNPLFLIHIAYVYLRQIIWPPSSVPVPTFVGYLSVETQSVHVFDQQSIRGLWSHGFFGKGSLSRSEPTWLEREKRRLGLLAVDTSEEYTRQRREERKAMKLERARKEREAIEQTLRSETGISITNATKIETETIASSDVTGKQVLTVASDDSISMKQLSIVDDEDIILKDDLKDEEHLQLTLEEAFFLAAILGVLEIKDQKTNVNIPLQNLLPLFMAYFTFPPVQIPSGALSNPDNPFIISYVAYHHFRSLGWVVKSGNKFSVDFLLYLRGPVFSHAEFAVTVIPSYEHKYWSDKGKEIRKPWHWFHMVNRVQSSVRKTLVFCYVDIPPPSHDQLINDNDLASIFKRYKVREFVLKRWSPNRNRG